MGFFSKEYDNIEAYDISSQCNWKFSKYNISKTWLLRKVISKFKATDVVLISYDQYFPAFHFLLPRDVHYISFMYYLYIYNWKHISLKNKIYNVLNYYLLVKNRAVYRILICNGTNEQLTYNKLYKTDKFVRIVDPISIDINRSLEKVPHVKKTFLHMGVLGVRKGTLDILDAVTKLQMEQCERVRLIFAGIIMDEIKEKFYQRINTLKDKIEIVVMDRFCSYDEIVNFCMEADFLLMPYSGTSQSSGMLAYASAFNLPVIATNQGMIRKLVQRNKLGYLINNDSLSIYTMIVNLLEEEPMQISTSYVERNSIKDFNDTFRSYFK